MSDDRSKVIDNIRPIDRCRLAAAVRQRLHRVFLVAARLMCSDVVLETIRTDLEILIGDMLDEADDEQLHHFARLPLTELGAKVQSLLNEVFLDEGSELAIEGLLVESAPQHGYSKRHGEGDMSLPIGGNPGLARLAS